MTKHPKRPRDPNQLAKLIVGIASGEERDAAPAEKNAAAVARGKLGGQARAAALPRNARKQIASRAAKARWKAPSDA